ncbi:MAG: general secretion pathway protein GspK [Acidobacteriota bacterium]|jgi:type II secretory pathway component PulK|nr:general secretion pathway protein GspK [Acidobacteriota bacterium]
MTTGAKAMTGAVPRQVRDRRPCARPRPRVPASADGEGGVILIVMLWILTALAVLTLSFAREGRMEVLAARNARALEQSYYIARAGIECTVYQILAKRLDASSGMTAVQDEPDPVDLGRVTGAYDGGVWQVDVQDESGKVSLNTVSEQQLRALVAAAGIEEPDASVIADSILDWRDTDSMPRENGAETEYYQALRPAYSAKNSGRFDAVEELLLVRGMTRDYYYGKAERAADGTVAYKYGLARFLTVYSTRDQVNVNHAALPVLLSIPGMTPEAASLIYERRQTQPFRSAAELNSELPVALGAGVMNRLTTAQAGILTLTAEAHPEGSKVRRVVRAVISLNATGVQNPYQTLYWNENISDYEGGGAS